MRVVAGRHRGRALQAPTGRDTRPTSDRARETLFNVLIHGHGVAFEGLRVLDAFAGSGAVGLEALSRGAAHAAFMETARPALAAIAANIQTLREEDRTTVLRADATRPPPAGQPCDLVFLDAPYGQDLTAPALAALAAKGWMAPGAPCVAEVADKEPFTPPPGFTLLEERRSGAARLVFLRAPG